MENSQWMPYCAKHGARVARHGAPDIVNQPGRLAAEALIEPTEDCCPHTGSLSRGYGPYRYVYRKLRGPIPEGMQLDHRCRYRPCVNPDHMEPVTQKENARRRDVAYRYELLNGPQNSTFWLAWDWSVKTRYDTPLTPRYR